MSLDNRSRLENVTLSASVDTFPANVAVPTMHTSAVSARVGYADFRVVVAGNEAAEDPVVEVQVGIGLVEVAVDCMEEGQDMAGMC